MYERNFGSADRTQVMVRAWRPWLWLSREFRWHWCATRRGSHRCYCATGWLIDFGFTVFGWGFIVFVSHYSGEIPCDCDRTIEEIFGKMED